MIRWEKEIQEFTVEELIEELLRWHSTQVDPWNNYDARLLKHAADVLQEQWDKIGKLEDQISNLINRLDLTDTTHSSNIIIDEI